MTLDFKKHPCFNADVKGKFGRIHLPVAPKCNIQCNFCNRKFDCVNESRPGVSSQILAPKQALGYLKEMKEADDRLTVMGIAGPGDPFANPEETMETLRLVRKEYPEMLLCVATNGLGAAPYIAELAELKVSHLTVTVNAIDPEIGQHVYAWVRDSKKILRGLGAAELLLKRQLEVIRLCKEHGIVVKINSILIPGVNDEHIVDVAKYMSELGVDLFNCMGMCRAEGAAFDHIPEADPSIVCAMRTEAEQYLPQMKHCQRCRADAVGCLSDSLPMKAIESMSKFSNGPLDPTDERPYVAAATMEGFLVNVHLGQARQFNIYSYDKTGGARVVDTRIAPEPGGGDQRWEKLAETLKDCRTLLVASAGPMPTKILQDHGTKVVLTESLIEQAVIDIYNNKPVIPPSRPRVCGSSCGGNAQGCA
ncbi:MAG: radical SAM protein [Planctomycetota bacterium]|jgi:nitrogen fixation protein NifB